MAVTINTDNLDFGELSSSPATPSAGRVRIYAKNDGKFYRKDDAGTETELGLATVSAVDVTYSPGTTADWNGSSDPGDTNDALDQLAERVKDIETAGTGLTARNAAGSVSVSDTTTLTFPNGWIASGGGTTAVISDVTNAFTPADSTNWDSTAPVTKTSALDKLGKRTRQAFGILEYSPQTVSANVSDNILFDSASVIVDKNMDFDFTTDADRLPVPYEGLYHYHMMFDLSISNAPLVTSLRITMFDQSAQAIANWDSEDYRAGLGYFHNEISGYAYHNSTSNYAYIQVYNVGNPTQSVDISYRMTVTRISGDD